jgi:nucleotide-binding universal stress UspA family protein
MFRRILVTLDGSAFAESALPAAVALARQSGGELRLVTVDPGSPSIDDSAWTFDEGGGARTAAERYLRATKERVESGLKSVTIVVRAGRPADEIIAEADLFRADLLVMATHARGALSRLRLGSVAHECTRRAERPVLLTRPTDPAEHPLRGVAIARIVVPLDGSEFSERALGPAIELGNVLGAPLALVRVVHDLTVLDPEFFPEAVAEADRIVQHDKSSALAHLERLAAPLRAWGLEVTTFVAAAPDAPSVLVERAGGDLIVMATHSRTGIARAVLGSVTDAVVHSATGPVLVIPPASWPRHHALAPYVDPRTMVPLGM